MSTSVHGRYRFQFGSSLTQRTSLSCSVYTSSTGQGGLCFKASAWLLFSIPDSDKQHPSCGHPAYWMPGNCWYYACYFLSLLVSTAALHIFMLFWDSLAMSPLRVWYLLSSSGWLWTSKIPCSSASSVPRTGMYCHPWHSLHNLCYWNINLIFSGINLYYSFKCACQTTQALNLPTEIPTFTLLSSE